MSTITLNQRQTVRTLRAAMHSEATKFCSLRPLVWLFLAGIAVSMVLAWLLGASAKASGENGYDTAMAAPLMVFATLQFGQLFFAAAAVLHLTGEYSADQISRTLEAVPRRGLLLAAKLVVVAVMGFAGGVLSVVLGTIPAALAAGDYGVFTGAQLVWAALGAGVYLALLAVMSLGLGMVCRNSTGGIVAMLMLVIGLPQVLQLIRIQWVQDVVAYLPTNAATLMATGATEPYGTGAALAVLVGWAVVLGGAGALRMVRSDA